jgi:NADP-dependent 3-hydroxy acid dehydrogenase YdfG
MRPTACRANTFIDTADPRRVQIHAAVIFKGELMATKRILITGAGSGFGELAAIGLAKEGHDVIAGVQVWPQATQLRRKVADLGLNNFRVEKLDLLHPYDVQNASRWDIDILVNNAATAESGPMSEIRLTSCTASSP